MSNSLDEARQIISSADAKMAELFTERMKAAEMVFAYKKEYGLPILDQKREEELIERNSSFIENSVIREYYVDFLKNLMDLSKKYQYRMQDGMKIAYSGVEGAFAHIAAGRIFPGGNIVSCTDFKAAYDSVVKGECDAAVLPIENSYAGEVGQAMDLIFSGSLYVNGIYELEIHQNLLGIPGASKDDITKVISHPQALSQCHEYITDKGLTAEEANNTAFAAKTVAALGDRTVGAIASVETAEIYGLEVLESNINKSGENTTRFVVLSKVRTDNNTFTNSVVMFTVKNEAGALANATAIIGKYGYNMTALRSRPLKKHSWQYYFYIEIDGRCDTENGKNMIKELSKVCDKLKIAGTYAPHSEI